MYRFGGSNAQRDAVARSLLVAAARSGDRALAGALISERLAVKDASPYNRRQLARIHAARNEANCRFAATTA